MSSCDVAVIGAGILGLATAAEITRRHPSRHVTVLDKEATTAAHQTGHNSGVLHSGVYYRPGTLKSDLARRGRELMVQFAHSHKIAREGCGKVIVATRSEQIPGLRSLALRAAEAGIPMELLGPAGLADREPHASGLAAGWVPDAGIIDYRSVCRALVEQARCDLRLSTAVRGIHSTTGGRPGVDIDTDRGRIRAGAVVNCAGLHSDRLARRPGVPGERRIVPFRGEYFELVPSARHLVRGLIYPVPDPNLPFLGVHLTRDVHGGVHAGPNAVLALAREGYRARDISLRDSADILSWPGMWRLARRHWRTGATEILRSASATRFAADAARLVPSLRRDDLVPSPAGVRAQSVHRDGRLEDDFVIVRDGAVIHLLNAPSPAATASLAIAQVVVDALDGGALP